MRNRQFVANIIEAPSLSYRAKAGQSAVPIYSPLRWRFTTRGRNRDRENKGPLIPEDVRSKRMASLRAVGA
jgi:hypothetical protein